MGKDKQSQPYHSGTEQAQPAPGATTLRAKLNLETSVIGWEELARHFARGAVLTVDHTLDLIEAAAAVAEDDRQQVEDWLDVDRLRRTTNAEARAWSDGDARLWTVVVAPWVLVQEQS